MDIKKEEIDKQIEILKKKISENKDKKEIKKEQKRLNKMLEEYLEKQEIN